MTARRFASAALAFVALAVGPATAFAQNADSDLAPVPQSEGAYGTAPAQPQTQTPAPAPAAPPAQAQAPAAAAPVTAATTDVGYEQDDVIAAAEGVFGKGAEGAAKLIEKAFADLGKPNAYIVGREASGAIIIGLRYGSGTLYHKVEGQMPVYWTGPSIGADVGGDGSKTFTLVYNLDDTEDLFRRYPAVEGKIYVIGGFTANYHQRGNVILVPIKLGVGWRLGANIGYLSYSKKSKILPF